MFLMHQIKLNAGVFRIFFLPALASNLLQKVKFTFNDNLPPPPQKVNLEVQKVTNHHDH